GFSEMFSAWKDNVMQSGVITGYLAVLFRSLFSKAGAAIVFIVLLIFFVLTAFNLTVSKIAESVKNRPHLEYTPEPEPEKPLPPIVKPGVKKPRKVFDAENAEELPAAPLTGKSGAGIDVPVDGPIRPARESSAWFDPNPSVATPDQVVKGRRGAVKPPVPIAEEPEPVIDPIPVPVPAPAPAPAPVPAPAPAPEPKPAKLSKEDKAEAEAEVAADIEKNLTEPERPAYIFPPLSLLTEGSPYGALDGAEETRLNAQRLSGALRSFGINAEICNVTRGPSVTRYEVELEQGVKLNKLTGLADDIALSLGATGVRIAPVPDKISIVGIDVPNKLTNIVTLREIIGSDKFRQATSPLSFAIGKDIGDSPVVGDISKLPHMLIAGTTGSGKSVCMNSLIISLLYKSSPEDVRLIMVDPKMIELGVYNGIPHMLIPVVTDPKKAAGALQWAVMEMLKRYKLFSESGARDLQSYNETVSMTAEGKKLPRIVVLIDELADLMLVAAKDVEESICRVAQMGRASGIHLVIATQRPSADVITGLMKANIPSRIAFAVDSSLNSRIILDQTGAEKLVGKGDMLYFPLGAGKPMRVQGTFVTDREREDVIEFVKNACPAEYDEAINQEIERNAQGKDKGAKTVADVDESNAAPDDDADEMLDDAVNVVLESGMASVSMLQRRLKLGYSRAARIVDQMEERGIVGPFEGSKPRPLLITREEWEARKSGAAPAPQMTMFEEDGEE
ncbi:MAG: DNA translocase FtsK, partial [Oscillospiraceae bacterium]|nr:DNA translocase FtsK [Oscillospiraceae bacterium]